MPAYGHRLQSGKRRRGIWLISPRLVPAPPLPLIEGDTILKSDLGHEDQNQLTAKYTERAVQFIERHHDQPFFFYLAHSFTCELEFFTYFFECERIFFFQAVIKL